MKGMAPRLTKKAVLQGCNCSENFCAISPDGTFVAIGGADGTVCINYLATQVTVYSTECNSRVTGVAWSPDGKRLIVVTSYGIDIQIANTNSRKTVFNLNSEAWGCAFSSRGILALSGLRKEAVNPVILLDTSNYDVLQTLNESAYPFVSLCFSPSGRQLLATYDEDNAAIWNVPFDNTWSSTPRVRLEGHKIGDSSGFFIGDESYVVTAPSDELICVWRTSNGERIETYECDTITSLSYHAASGSIVLGGDRQVELWQTDPYIAPAPQAAQPAHPAHVCVRERLAVAQAQAKEIQAEIEKADARSREQMTRAHELKQSIAELEEKLASEKKALEELETAESRDYIDLFERHNDLLGIIHVCTQTLDSLTDCLETSGLEDLRGETFNEWLCDIGMIKLQTALKAVAGVSLTMLNVSDVMANGVSFPDAAALQLRGYIAHYKLSDDSAFPPPPESVLSWDQTQTANWIESLGEPYASLASAGWNGPALCSLSPPRVIETGNGMLNMTDAVKFINLVKAKRSETDGGKGAWVAKWSGLVPIANDLHS